MGDLDKERLQCNEGKIWVRRVERVGEERVGEEMMGPERRMGEWRG